MSQPRGVWLVLLLAVPLAGFALLVADPRLDVHWQHDPSHFWLVLAASAVTASLAYATGTAARRRADARVHLVSLAFLAAAGFLGLHALATPGVLLKTSNVGFALATPLGLALAGALAAASSFDLGDWSVGRLRLVQNTLLALLAAWGVLSLTALPKLHDTTAFERASGPLLAVASVGVVLYGIAVVRYLRLYRRRPRSTPARLGGRRRPARRRRWSRSRFGRNWHASWWEWHVLILLAVRMVGLASAPRVARGGGSAVSTSRDPTQAHARADGALRRHRRGSPRSSEAKRARRRCARCSTPTSDVAVPEGRAVPAGTVDRHHW